jgi:hypothetical protein
VENIFEKQFSDLQADMVSVCLEYSERKCEQIFIHIICENDSVFTNFFFRIDGAMRKKGKLSDIDAPVSVVRQKEALSIITKDARKIVKLCNSAGKPAPTDYKLIYQVGAGSLKAEYSYDPITSAD